MFGKPSSSQPRIGLGGSGALSHVYIQYPPLRCSIPGARGFFYDDGNKLLISPTTDQVFSWQVSRYASCDAPSSDSVSEGPVLSIRYSLDGNIIAIQRSNNEIEFRNQGTGSTFNHRCRSDHILGFFWTDCPTCDIVIIKSSGVDMCSYEPQLNALRLVDSKRLNVSWYVHTHESRLVLLASGMQCKSLTGFQFSSGGIIRLPRFDITMARAEANQKPVLLAEDVHIATIYGRIYCIQVDQVGMLLHFYRFYRDAVVHQGSLPIYSIKVAVSVVDNVLLVHQVDAKVVLLYDIFTDSRAPISAPLPLLVRGSPGVCSSPTRAITGQTTNVLQSTKTDKLNEDDVVVYGDGWVFLAPDLICDASHGTLWRICLDLEAIAASSSDTPSLLEFLQQRRLDSLKAKRLCLVIMRTAILERRSLPMIAKAMGVLSSSYSHSLKLGSSLQRGSRFTSQRSAFYTGATSSSLQHISSTEVTSSGIKQEATTREVERHPMHLNRTSSVSDSEDSVNLEHVSSNLEEPHAISNPRDPSVSKLKGPRKNYSEAETSNPDNEKASIKSDSGETNGDSLDSGVSDPQSFEAPSVTVSPNEMYISVFALVEEEMAGDPAYLVAVIVEYFRSAALEKLKVHPSLNILIIQLLARNDRYAEIQLFVVNKILEPSKEVALQLLESGRHNLPTRKLGMDMLRQLLLHNDYVLMLLQDGYYLEAIRYVRRNKVNTIRPSLFLEAAMASNDPQHLASVLRFFSEFLPDFRNTSDHSTFRSILNEMSRNSAACVQSEG
ncbi:uncharacterized protein C18orf8 isoform X1 [Amborella trichopoda]|nr:uncharacterized protein C18orf8 isoform X1 [Amborella trichopoda]|eukprot:XP_011625281.1 uncharacterized protein C18orf8 isoform X1 [Amborella trichopoda]